MENRITPPQAGHRDHDPQPIGAILAELLAQYQIRFPEVRITVVEIAAAA